MTLLIAAVAFGMYVAMGLGVYAGVLPAHALSVAPRADLPIAWLLLAFLFAACAIGIPALVAARLLGTLRERNADSRSEPRRS